MTTIRLSLAVVAVVVAMTACSSDSAGSAANGDTSTPPASSGATTAAAPAQQGGGSTTGDRVAVETVFRDYQQALAARDFARACALSAPETAERFQQRAAAGGFPAGTCEEAFTGVYADAATAQVADRIANTTQIAAVTVTGDDATVTWSAQLQDRRPSVTSGLRRIDGQWRLLPS